MSLTVKHLNSDASFLLTFQPILDSPPSPEQPANAFTILLDPWIVGPSKIWHPKFSISRQKLPSCISSLQELPEPDVVVISQDKSDHCHEQTLMQLPRSGGKTTILAEPGAAKIIRGWKHFDAEKVVTLRKWEDPRPGKVSTVHRIPIPPLAPNGKSGEVTVTFIPQKKDLTGLHSAIGITYRAPTASGTLPTPPTTPPALAALAALAALTPPDTPRSFQSTFSHCERPLSVIFSPHGCTYNTLAPYAKSHLAPEAALPLTALLHCFDRVTNTWYMGGNICSGFPGGLEIAQNLSAKAWISAHDGDKISTGFANNKVVFEKFSREEVESVVSPRSEKFPGRKTGTEAVVLQTGEEITLNRIMDFGADSSDEGSFVYVGEAC